MKRNNFFSRFIVVTLLSALLLVSGSRAIRVSALADPVPITAVYDTTIIQLADYVDTLPDPSIDVFYLLTGVLAAAQLGGQEYKLEDPYATSSDVIDWFKSLGIRLYNTVIGLYPNQDPILGFDVRPYIKPLVAAMMGNAVMSRNYNGIDDFMASDDDALVPFKRDIQDSINVIWQIQGGPFHWQFDSQPFTSGITFNVTDTIQDNIVYNEMREFEPYAIANDYQMTPPRFRTICLDFEYDELNLFFNTSDSRYYVMTNSGQSISSIRLENYAFIYNSSVFFNSFPSGNNANYFVPSTFTVRTGNSFDITVPIAETARNLFSNTRLIYSPGFFVLNESMIHHVYAGTNWVDKQEVFNLTDLNIADDGNDYYETPTDDNLLIDIKNLITDLVDNTDIWTHIINNVYDPDGTQIVNPPTIKVSVDLTPITELLDPPIPVNLNDIAELTDNTYLERVKEHARNAGDIFANYVAFWHNCDSDLVYTVFGAAILVLVGAFVGKWGHS